MFSILNKLSNENSGKKRELEIIWKIRKVKPLKLKQGVNITI